MTHSFLYLLPIVCIAAGVIVELSLYIIKLGAFAKNIILICSLALSTFGASALLVSNFNPISFLIAFFTVYRAINLIKIAKNRINPEYLQTTTFRTYSWLATSQIILIIIWYILYIGLVNIGINQTLLVISGLFLLSSLAIALSTLMNVLNSFFKPKKYKKIQDFPTLTLAIAARNENSMLEDCLACAIANNYPKLEIIVYDDCSQDKTAEIIKSYAQKGVRFIQGGEVPEKWLAKNWAYQKLLEQSSGDLIMFMGVDVQLQPDTLNKIMTIFIKRKVNMMSIMPKRIKSGFLAAFIQPMRYWWEFAIPSYILKRPPVLSTCWIIRQDILNKNGGFKSVTRAIIPEEQLAKAQAKIYNYAFVVSSPSIGLNTFKNFYSQWSTAIRTRYPQVHRRPENVAIRSILMVICLLLPFIFMFIPLGDYEGYVFIFAASIVSVVMLVASNVLISLISNPAAVAMSILNFPVVVALDIFALNYSMYKYEFSEVIWKGRNVSRTAMHSIKHLPRI